MTTTPPGGKFFHEACVKQALRLVGGLLAVAFAGVTLAYSGTGKGLGLYILAVGPGVTILCHFASRFSSSVMNLQVFFVFFEAILWMTPLSNLVLPSVDSAIASAFNAPWELTCGFPAGTQGFGFAVALSLQAQCADVWGTTSFQLAGDRRQRCGDSRWMTDDGRLAGAGIAASIESSVYRGVEDAPTCFGDGLKGVAVMGPVGVKLSLNGRSTAPENLRQMVIACNAVYPGQCNERDLIRGYPLDVTEESTLMVTLTGVRKTVAHVFMVAFFRAAFLEELLKYITVRRILFKDRVADSGAVLVYGLAAAAGFATEENTQYVFRSFRQGGDVASSLKVGLVRLLMSVPLHCCTGLMIGMNLGRRKFLGESHRMLNALLPAVATHGLYDFFLMLAEATKFPLGLAVLLTILGPSLGGYLYCRHMWKGMEKVCVADISALTKAGKVSPPRCCCGEPDCCNPMFQHDDPALAQASSRSTFQQLPRGASFALFPAMVNCETREAKCYQCQNEIRVLLFYPSRCPHCEAPHMSAMDAVRTAAA